jgi:HK97 family phage portal protein
MLTKVRAALIKALGLNDEKAWNPSLWNLVGSQSQSGENVNEHSALTYSAVWNAVTLISGTVSCLPLHLYRKNNRKTLKVTQKKLYNVMYQQANELMTAQTFREVMTAHILLWGNCYAEIVRDGFGEIAALWPIPPNRIKQVMLDDKLVYRVSVGNEQVILPRERILHVSGLGFDGFQGYSVIAMARKSIGLGMAMETFGSLYFGNGTHPGVVVSHPGKLSQVAHENLKGSLAAAHSGLGQSHRLLLLEEGMKVDKISIPPEESQFNLPPHKLKDLTRSSFNNIESEQISFVTDSILPWLIRFEQNYWMQLLTDSEKNQEKLYFKHNVKGLLRGNSKDRSEYYKSMWSNGFMTQNEIRELEDMDPSDDELADDLFVPLNMIPISMLKEYLEKNEPKEPTATEGEDIPDTEVEPEEDGTEDQTT